jgi:translation initiation factor IF-2
MRVHELAKSLKLSSKELIEKLGKLGVEAKSHMSTLDVKAVKLMTEGLKQPSKPAPVKPAMKPPVASAAAVKQETKPAPPPLLRPVGLPAATAVVEPTRIQIPITVGDLAVRLKLKTSELIKSLMNSGIFANVNQLLSEEIVLKVSGPLGIAIEKIEGKEETAEGPEEKVDLTKLKPRPPVVTLMGHVDHGKTSLLDAIRNSDVVGGEAGQITQHIGAYGVDLPGKGHVTFLDTPGHEAFTEMRARGANVTDVVVLVVAADDGVMPQTIEAIDHAREAGVPILVAVNKCDLPQANPQKVSMQLQKLDLVAEEWGGKTIFCKISAKTGEGIDHLLEMLLLEAEVLELKANPDQMALGAVIESRLTKGSGPVATVIVQKGTLRIGDTVIAGPYFGRVRALRNDRGKGVREVGPSGAVEVIGLNGVPDAGETLRVVEDEKAARRITEGRLLEIREREMKGAPKHLSLENLYQKIKEGTFKELKLILKGDVQGSIEALAQSLEKASAEKVHVRVIHGGVGSVNESDVMLAAASDAIIIGFHVKAEPRAEQMGETEGVDMRFYNIIYNVVEDVKKAMEGLLEPIYTEVLEGRAEVRQVFRSSKAGTVGGGVVVKGKLTRSNKVRLIRNQIVVFDGKLSSLRRFKDDVREVAEGYEFGFVLEGSSDIHEKDLLETYRIEKGPAPQLR